MNKKTLNKIAWFVSGCISVGILYDMCRELKKKQEKLEENQEEKEN